MIAEEIQLQRELAQVMDTASAHSSRKRGKRNPSLQEGLEEIGLGKYGTLNMDALWQEIDTLPGRSPELMKLLFDRCGQRSKLTLAEVGAVFGIGKERVRQERNISFRRLAHPQRRYRFIEQGVTL